MSTSVFQTQPTNDRTTTPERITLDTVFGKVCMDYAGPVYLKQDAINQPGMVKAYINMCISIIDSQDVRLELVSDLTAEVFEACLGRFIAWRGKLVLILWELATTKDQQNHFQFLYQSRNFLRFYP